MNPDIKARWVQALRSGEYQQGRSRLADVEEGQPTLYCCLGVLCELAVADGVIERWEDDNEHGMITFGQRPGPGDPIFGTPGNSSSSTVLPTSVRDWAGLPDVNPSLPSPVCICSPEELAEGGGCTCSRPFALIDLNDDTSCGFERIALEIEQQL